MKKIVLIPAYEPDNRLVELIKSINKKDFDIIVVNDGSNSSYDKIFNKIKDSVHYIKYNKNKGKGYALKEGFKYIKKNYKNYIVVTMDSDGQHTIKDANNLIDYVMDNMDVLAIGKRNRNTKIPIRSKFGNEITSKVFKFTTGISIYDTQSGLRAFSDKLMDFLLNVKGNRFEYEMNVLLFASKNNIKMKEIDIETIYIDNNKSSHFNAIKDSYRIYKEIIKYSLSSFISFLVDYILYSIFNLFLSVINSNIFARIISCNVNYFLNKKFVFKSNKNQYTYLQYIILVIINLFINTLILSLIVNIGINKYVAKLFAEICLYILNYYIQKYIIFKK